MSLKDAQDAYGHALLDQMNGFKRSGYAQGEFDIHIPVERDDGLIDVHPAAIYFSGYDEWPEFHRQAIDLARGRVLDIGCGAGRHSLYLQDKGLDVIAIDTSPLAIEICARRGVRNGRLMSITQLSSALGTFDTVLMLGNNFGLVQDRKRAGVRLKRLFRMTSPGARIIAETLDPYQTDDPFHFEYHARNRERKRMSGEVRIRVRYRKYKTPWFDYLFVSRDEMRQIIAGTGWEVTRFIDSGGSLYIATLEKEVSL